MKLRWDEIPLNALEKVVEAYTIGVEKHKDKLTQCDAALIAARGRHWAEFYIRHNRIDPSDGKHHLAAVVFYDLELLRRDIERAELEATRCDLMDAIEEHEERGDIWAGKRRNLSESIMRSSVQSCPCDRLGTGGTKYQGE